MTPNKERALQALLTHPNKKLAAESIGITPRTMTTYLSDPEFQAAYKAAFGELVKDATRQAQRALSPALSALVGIVQDENENSSARIAAARTLLEYGLRLTEITDILQELSAVEGDI